MLCDGNTESILLCDILVEKTVTVGTGQTLASAEIIVTSLHGNAVHITGPL